jgi:hypothetical protein
MQLFKIACSQCPHYDSCPKKTQMFVNYCGSTFQNVEMNVRAAISECRSKHGYMLQSVVSSASTARLKAKKNLAGAGA